MLWMVESTAYPVFGILLAAASAIGFASTFVFGGALARGRGVSPFAVAFLRFALSLPLVVVIECRTSVSRRRILRAPERKDWLLFAVLGPVGTSLMAWCTFLASARVNAANVSLIDALAPLLIFAGGVLCTRRLCWLQAFGALAGFGGALLVLGIVSKDGLAIEGLGTGDLFVFLSALLWALYTVCGRRTINRLGAGVFTVWTMVAGTAAFAPFASDASLVWPKGADGWWLTVGLSVLGTVVPFWAWNAAQRFLSVSALGTSAYFTPVAAMALAFLFLGERSSALQVAGSLLVCLSAVIEARGVRAKDPASDGIRG